MIRSTYYRVKEFFERYERWLLPATLLAGVLIDFVTFKTINLKASFILLSSQAVIAGLAVFAINVIDSRESLEKYAFFRYVRLLAPFIIQLTFGALLSASFAFYWFSGAFSVSWPFFVILILLMISNDALRHYYLKPVVQLPVYYFALFALVSIALPYALHSLLPSLFIASGLIAGLVVFAYYTLLARFIPDLRREQVSIFSLVGFIFFVMNALYFLNYIPPIPLVLQDAGIYHSLERRGDEYLLADEDRGLLERLIPGTTVRVAELEQVFAFSAISAPADLRTSIIHEWQHFDPAEKEWVTKSSVSFTISGGREDGFRGYSMKSRLEEGRWRINVKTPRKQTIGRIHFRVDQVAKPVKTVPITK